MRRESEAQEQLAVDLVLSIDVYSAQSLAKGETKETEDDELETMSRAAEAMTLSERELPSNHFGYLSPIPVPDHPLPPKPAENASTSVVLPPGVRLLLAEWDIGADPDQYTYHDPYDDDDQQPVTTHPTLHKFTQRHGIRDGSTGHAIATGRGSTGCRSYLGQLQPPVHHLVHSLYRVIPAVVPPTSLT